MKKYTTSEIVTLVRTKYDEIGLNESDMMDTTQDSANLDTVIRSCIASAYRFAVTGADLSMLEGKQYTKAALTIDSNRVGHVSLPSDFLRGVTFRLSSWQSSASDIITEDSPEYRMQSDPWACGTYQQPVVALVHTANGRELEFYKAKSASDTLKSFVYMPEWDNSSEAVDVPDLMAEAFIYYVAGLTATTFREDVANDFFKVARSLLGIE